MLLLQVGVLEGWGRKPPFDRIKSIISFIKPEVRGRLDNVAFEFIANSGCATVFPASVRVHNALDIFEHLSANGWRVESIEHMIDSGAGVEPVARVPRFPSQESLRALLDASEAAGVAAADKCVHLMSDLEAQRRHFGPNLIHPIPTVGSLIDGLLFESELSPGSLSTETRDLWPPQQLADGVSAAPAAAAAGGAGSATVAPSSFELPSSSASSPSSSSSSSSSVPESREMHTAFAKALSKATDKFVFFLAGVSGVGKSKLGLAAMTGNPSVALISVPFAAGGFTLCETWAAFEGLFAPLIRVRRTHNLFVALFTFVLAMYLRAALGIVKRFYSLGARSNAPLYRKMLETLFFLDRVVSRAPIATLMSNAMDSVRRGSRWINSGSIDEFALALSGETYFSEQVSALSTLLERRVVFVFDEATALRGRLVGVVQRQTRLSAASASETSAPRADHGVPDFLYGLLVVCANLRPAIPIITGSQFSLIEDGVADWSPVQNVATSLVVTQQLTVPNMVSALQRLFTFPADFFELGGEQVRHLSLLRGRPAFFFTYFLVPLLLAFKSVVSDFVPRAAEAFDLAVEVMYKLIRKLASGRKSSSGNVSSSTLLAELLWADRATGGIVSLNRLGSNASKRGVALSRGILPINPFQSVGFYDLNDEPVVRTALRLFSDRQLSRYPEDPVHKWIFRHPTIFGSALKGPASEVCIFFSLVRQVFHSHLQVPLWRLLRPILPSAYVTSKGRRGGPTSDVPIEGPAVLRGLKVSARLGYDFALLQSRTGNRYPTAFHALFLTAADGSLVIEDGSVVPLLNRVVINPETTASGPDVLFWAYDPTETEETDSSRVPELTERPSFRRGRTSDADTTSGTSDRETSCSTGDSRGSSPTRSLPRRSYEDDRVEEDPDHRGPSSESAGTGVFGFDTQKDDSPPEADDDDGLQEQEDVDEDDDDDFRAPVAGDFFGAAGSYPRYERSVSFIRGAPPVIDDLDAIGEGRRASRMRAVRLVAVQSKASSTATLKEFLNSLHAGCQFLNKKEKGIVFSGQWRPEMESSVKNVLRRPYLDLLRNEAARRFLDPFVRVVATSRGVQPSSFEAVQETWSSTSPVILSSFGVKEALEALGDASTGDTNLGTPHTPNVFRHVGFDELYRELPPFAGGAAGGGGAAAATTSAGEEEPQMTMTTRSMAKAARSSEES